MRTQTARLPAQLRSCRAIAGQSIVDADDPHAFCRQAVAQFRLSKQHTRAGVFQHEAKPLRRVGGVERQIGAANRPRLEDAEQPDDHLQRTLDTQPDHHVGTDAEIAQMIRELIGPPVEFAIGQLIVRGNTTATASGVFAACAANRSGKVAARQSARRIVPAAHDRGRPLRSGQNVDAADRTVRRAPTAASNKRMNRWLSASIVF